MANAAHPASGSMNDPSARTAAMSAILARNWWAVALRGLAAILFGLVALFVPGATILSLVLFFSAYMLVDGILGIVAAVRAAGSGGRWGLLVLEGVANIATGLVAFVWPGLTAVVFVLLIAVWSVVTGILMVVAAFRLDRSFGRGWLVFSGVVSVLLGIVFVIAPLAGLIVLTWWLGAYAVVFGVTLLMLAIKLRDRKTDQVVPTGATAAPR